jgi:uncharacterized protein (DUF4415 family)
MVDRTRRMGGDARENAERAFRAATTKPAEVAPAATPTVGPRSAAVPKAKELVSIRLDRDVLERFQATGPSWQERINEALRKAAGL